MRYVIAIGVVLALIIGGLKYAYDSGYETGKHDVEAVVLVQKQEWEKKIATLNTEHQKVLREMELSHERDKTKLQAQIDALKSLSFDEYITVEENSKLPVGFIQYHNRLALNVPVNSMLSEYKGKEVRLKDLMRVMGENYITFHQTRVRLEHLQTIVKDFLNKQGELK